MYPLLLLTKVNLSSTVYSYGFDNVGGLVGISQRKLRVDNCAFKMEHPKMINSQIFSLVSWARAKNMYLVCLVLQMTGLN